jgi:hypothetical protein
MAWLSLRFRDLLHPYLLLPFTFDSFHQLIHLPLVYTQSISKYLSNLLITHFLQQRRINLRVLPMLSLNLLTIFLVLNHVRGRDYLPLR